MSAEKKYTERDLVMAKREGWDECAYQMTVCGQGSKESDAMRDATFPLPKVVRPRVVEDPTSIPGARFWRVCDGKLQTRKGRGLDTEWYDQQNAHAFHDRDFPYPTRERLQLWSDLLANPTEEVEE